MSKRYLFFITVSLLLGMLYSNLSEYSIPIPFDLFIEKNMDILEKSSCLELNLITVSKIYNNEFSLKNYNTNIKSNNKLNIFGLDFQKLKEVNLKVNPNTSLIRFASDTYYIKYLLKNNIPVFLTVFNFNNNSSTNHSILLTGYNRIKNKFIYFDTSAYLSAHSLKNWQNKYDSVKSHRMEILGKEYNYKKTNEIDELLKKSNGYLEESEISHFLSFYSPYAIIKKENKFKDFIQKFNNYSDFYIKVEKKTLFGENVTLENNKKLTSYLPKNMKKILDYQLKKTENKKEFYNITKEIIQKKSSIYYYYLHIINCIKIKNYDEVYNISKDILNDLTMDSYNLYQNKMIYLINAVIEKTNNNSIDKSQENLFKLWDKVCWSKNQDQIMQFLNETLC